MTTLVKSRLRESVQYVLMVVIILTLGALTWNLVLQNNELERERTSRVSRLGADFVAGDVIPTVELAQLDGSVTDLADLARSPVVIVFFTTTCPYCKMTLPIWGQLFSRLEPDGIQLVGVSLHPIELTRQYVRQNNIAWPVWVLSDPTDATLKVRAVPLTIVASQGRVVGAWSGALLDSGSNGVFELAERAAIR